MEKSRHFSRTFWRLKTYMSYGIQACLYSKSLKRRKRSSRAFLRRLFCLSSVFNYFRSFGFRGWMEFMLTKINCKSTFLYRTLIPQLPVYFLYKIYPKLDVDTGTCWVLSYGVLKVIVILRWYIRRRFYRVKKLVKNNLKFIRIPNYVWV